MLLTVKIMKEIKLKDSSVETKKMDTEFIHWECPTCGKAHRTIEWALSNKELWCDKCEETVKYSWE